MIRIHRRTGKRQIVADNSRLFNFPVAATFAPRDKARGRTRLLVASDQEYRWKVLNGALTENNFKPPFLVTEFEFGRSGSDGKAPRKRRGR